MLKHLRPFAPDHCRYPAAFRRLCVETTGQCLNQCFAGQPPSGGCVLKLPKTESLVETENQPPSGGCVLKPAFRARVTGAKPSRLQAAVC